MGLLLHLVQIVDISCMVLLMMNLHDFSRNDRLQSIVIIWQIRQDVLGANRTDEWSLAENN